VLQVYRYSGYMRTLSTASILHNRDDNCMFMFFTSNRLALELMERRLVAGWNHPQQLEKDCAIDVLSSVIVLRPVTDNIAAGQYITCYKAVELLTRSQPSMLDQWTPSRLHRWGWQLHVQSDFTWSLLCTRLSHAVARPGLFRGGNSSSNIR